MEKLTRKEFLRFSAMAAVGTVLAACVAPTPQVIRETVVVTKEVPVTKEVTKEVTVPVTKEVTKVVTQEVTKVVTKEVGLKQVPRNRTLVLQFGGSGGAWASAGIANPYATGWTHQEGNAAMLEPLFFYSAFAGEHIPWLAESHQWNSTFTEVVIKIRKGVEWSDGKPFTAKDPVFTFNMLIKHAPKLRNSAEFKTWVKECTATDDYTLKIVFTGPNPRFVFDYLSFKFDTGQYIIPEHIFKDIADPTTFLFFDPDKGWPVATGPYKLTLNTTTQKFLDRRDNYWGAKTGFAKLPAVERILVIPNADETKSAQLCIQNVTDAALDLRPLTIKSVVQQNPKVITHTFDKPPYGYVDWWPISLCFNDREPPYSDPDIRWAVSYAIDRQQMIQVAYEGAGQATIVPFPYYPPLMKYIDGIKDLLEKYPTNKVDLAKSAELLKGKGYAKDKDGFWAKDGKRLTCEMGGWQIFADIGPVLAEQLRKAGFDASFSMPADLGTRISQGTMQAFPNGHGGSIADPFLTFALFHSRKSAPTGEPHRGAPFRWENPEFDAIVDEMAKVPMGDPKVMELFRKGMEIWLKNLPDVPLIQWFHRIPMNTTYWTGWPTEKDPYLNGAFWHLTFPLILQRLKPVQ